MLPQQISTDVLIEKYAKGNETTADEIFKRVAKGVAAKETDFEKWALAFYENMKAGAVGAGRIMSNAGTDIQATLINCFVQPVGDSFQGKDQNGFIGIYDALREAGETMRRGGGVGYDFSKIRPKNAKVKGTNSNASGPCSFMDVFDASCKTVESAGARRGAQMGVMRIDHPDVMDFIKAKRTPGRWNNFNVSVFVSDEFMACKDLAGMWELVHAAEPSVAMIEQGALQRADGKWVYGVVNALELWKTIMQSNYDYAEPGILYESKMNSDNNLRYIEILEATNPCAEEPLPDYGCCCLAPIILPRFVKMPFTANAEFDHHGFTQAINTHVRFLDNILDVTFWPLPAQQQEAQNKRRVGLGFTGIGNALAMLNIAYNSAEGLAMAQEISREMRDVAYLASVELAKERGAFPLFDAEKYLEEGTFASRLPLEIKDLIRKHGIRNSHLLSIAPVGTVSLAFADNASNGIEPPFSLAYTRKKRMADGSHQFYQVIDHGLRVYLSCLSNNGGSNLAGVLLKAICDFKTEFEFEGVTRTVKDNLPIAMITAMDLSVDEHLAMLEAVQPFIDSSISKTVNVPADYPFEDFAAIYDRAHKAGLKGVSTYRPNAIIGSVLSVAPTPPAPVAEGSTTLQTLSTKVIDVNPLQVMISKRPEGEVESKTSKVRYSSHGGDQSLYVTVSFTKVAGVVAGKAVEIERPLEVFVQASPDGVPMEWVAAYARNLSLLARAGLLAKALQDNRSVRSDKGRVRYGWYVKADGSKVPRYHESEVACIAFAVQEILAKRGLIDEAGNAVLGNLGSSSTVTDVSTGKNSVSVAEPVSMSGKKCPECGAHAVIKKDGCEFCTSCGHLGACG